MGEYFNLINRMREGVLVLIRDPHNLAQGTSEIKFSNKSSEKIFDTLDRSTSDLTIDDLKLPRFMPTRLLKEHLVGNATFNNNQSPPSNNIDNNPGVSCRSDNSALILQERSPTHAQKLISLEKII